MGTGNGGEVALAEEGAGIGAGDVEDVGSGPEAGGVELVCDDCFSANLAASNAAALMGFRWGDDGGEDGCAEPSDNLTGVEGAAIVLIGVDSGLVRVGWGEEGHWSSPSNVSLFM